MKRHAFAVLTAALALGSAACNGTTDPAAAQQAAHQAALDRAKAQWNAAGVHDYAFDLAYDQFGAHDSLQVQVRNDQVVSATSYLSYPHLAPVTVPDLFSRVQDALLNGANVSTSYDSRLGVPIRASWDSGKIRTPGGGASYRIVDFAQLP